MPDDQSITPILDSIPSTDSAPLDTPSDAQNAPVSDSDPVSLKDDNEAIPLEPTDLPANPASNGTGEIPADNPPVEANYEPISEPAQASEPSATMPAGEVQADRPTDQIPVNEPLTINTIETKPEKIPTVSPESNPASASSKPTQKDLWKRFLDKVQIGKRKKLERIVNLFATKQKITNDEVEKFLHVSDATATRYLSILEKEGKIRQVGKTGKYTYYEKV